LDDRFFSFVRKKLQYFSLLTVSKTAWSKLIMMIILIHNNSQTNQNHFNAIEFDDY